MVKFEAQKSWKFIFMILAIEFYSFKKFLHMVFFRFFFIKLILMFLLFLPGNVKAIPQSKKDSLLQEVKKANKKLLPQVQNKLAEIYYEEGDVKTAMDWAKKSLALAKENRDFSEEADALKKIGICENFQGNYDKAFELFKEAAVLYNDQNNKKNYADCLNQQALCYYYQSKISKAIEYFQQAIKINQDIQQESAPLLSNTGLAYDEIGLYDKAFELYLKALKIDEKLKDTVGIAADFANIATIFIHQNNFLKAIEYYKKSYQIFVNSGRKEQIAILSADIGATYFQLKQFDKALTYFSTSLKIRREINNPNMIANICNSLGNVYVEKKEYDKAIDLFTEALKLSQTIHSVKSTALAQLNIGVVYKRQGKYTEAKSYLEKSSIIAGSEKIFDLLPDIYLNISDVWANQNDFKKSLEYFKRYTAVNDTIKNKSREKMLFELETRYETAKKEQEISFLKKDNELIHERSIMKNIIIIISFVVIFILVLLSYTSYRLYREKKLANDILQEEFKMINEKLTIQNSGKQYNIADKDQSVPQKLIFYNSAGIAELEINCNDLFYIVSLENYLEIFWINDKTNQKTIIRNTMKNVEQMLTENKSLARCHRSYIVNLIHVKQVIGKSQNYKLQFHNDMEDIPISRNFSKDILIKINSLRHINS